MAIMNRLAKQLRTTARWKILTVLFLLIGTYIASFWIFVSAGTVHWANIGKYDFTYLGFDSEGRYNYPRIEIWLGKFYFVAYNVLRACGVDVVHLHELDRRRPHPRGARPASFERGVLAQPYRVDAALS